MKVALSNVTNGQNVSAINNNFAILSDALNYGALYRDNPSGEPNQMENVLDANGNRIINLPAPVDNTDAARLQDVQDAIAGAKTAALTSFVPYKDITATNVQGAIQQESDARLSLVAQIGYSQLYSVNAEGAVKGGTIDASVAFQAAVNKAALNGGGIVIASPGTYLLNNTVILPSNVIIDLQMSTLLGAGIATGTDMFQTGYLSGNISVTNIGSANESHLVINSGVRNAIIMNANVVFNFFNAVDNCFLDNIHFTDVAQAVKASRSFYSSYSRLFCRGYANGATTAAFYFTDNVNVMDIRSVFAEGRLLGFELDGLSQGQTLYNCSAENCTTGLKVVSAVGPLKLDTFYFESISGNAVDMNDAGFKQKVTIENCWFLGCGVGVYGAPAGQGNQVFISRNTIFTDCGTNVVCNDTTTDLSIIEFDPISLTDNGTPTLPAGYILASSVRVDAEAVVHSSVDGSPLMKAKVHGPELIAFEHSGYAGTVPNGQVMFSSTSASGTGTFNVIINTNIAYSEYSALVAYRLTIIDNIGSNDLAGFIMGKMVQPLDSSGKTITVGANANGYLQITIGQFSHPTGAYSATGVVRFI